MNHLEEAKMDCPKCGGVMKFRNYWKTRLFGITFWHWFCKECKHIQPYKEDR